MSRSHNERSLGHELGARRDAKRAKKISVKKTRRSSEANPRVLKLIQKSVHPAGWMRIKREELWDETNKI